MDPIRHKIFSAEHIKDCSIYSVRQKTTFKKTRYEHVFLSFFRLTWLVSQTEFLVILIASSPYNQEIILARLCPIDLWKFFLPKHIKRIVNIKYYHLSTIISWYLMLDKHQVGNCLTEKQENESYWYHINFTLLFSLL